MATTKLVVGLLMVLAIGIVAIGAGLRPDGRLAGRQDTSSAETKEISPQGKPAADPRDGQALQLTLAAPREEYRSGEPVDLTLTLKNNGKEEFSYLLYRIGSLQGLTMTGPDGKEVQPSRNPVEIDWSNVRVTVLPGKAESVKDALRCINLAEAPGTDHYVREIYYPMEAPGTYGLRIKVGEVTSNELQIKVLPADGFGDEVKGLRARVSLAKQKYQAGEPIKVHYQVKNGSKEEQTLWSCGFWPNHLILVHDDAGKEPPLTELGQQRRQAFAPGGERDKNVAVKVPAGDEDSAYEIYDPTTLYDLSQPGRYTVQYIYEEKQGGWEGRLPSNAAAFEILPRAQREAGGGKEESKLQGLWLATELDGAGQNAARDGKEWRMLVKGDKIALVGKGEKREYRFKLRSLPNDKGIDLFPVRGEGRKEAEALPGIYHMAGDRLTLCFYKDAAKGRPPEFSAKIDIGLWGLECKHVLESKAVRVEGLEFVALAPVGVGPGPVGGIRDQIDLGLQVTNVSDKPLALCTFDVIRPRLYTADGRELTLDRGRDGEPKPLPRGMLAPGASWTWKAQAELSWAYDPALKVYGDRLKLYGRDGRGVAGFWSFTSLKVGKYRLAVEYANGNPKQDDVPLWVGKATTEEVEFDIVPAEG
jgi:uncharacterized protein (TIGR03067 family)